MTEPLGDAPDEGFEVVTSTHRFTGRVISLRTDRVRFADGTESDRDIVGHPGAVAVVALDDEDRVVLVHQHRQPVDMSLDELPAGLLDVDGEDRLVAAQRELFEEARLRAGRWNVLLDLHTSPGMTDEAIRVYLARDLTAADDEFTPEHEEVTMVVKRAGLDDAVAAVQAGRITNAAACAGILATALARAGGWRGLRPADAPWPNGGPPTDVNR